MSRPRVSRWGNAGRRVSPCRLVDEVVEVVNGPVGHQDVDRLAVQQQAEHPPGATPPGPAHQVVPVDLLVEEQGQGVEPMPGGVLLVRQGLDDDLDDDEVLDRHGRDLVTTEVAALGPLDHLVVEQGRRPWPGTARPRARPT